MYDGWGTFVELLTDDTASAEEVGRGRVAEVERRTGRGGVRAEKAPPEQSGRQTRRPGPGRHHHCRGHPDKAARRPLPRVKRPWLPGEFSAPPVNCIAVR